MFDNLKNNLSKKQKIGILIVFEIIFLIFIIATINASNVEKTHVNIENPNESSIPNNAKEFISKTVWNAIYTKVGEQLKTSNITDAKIREGTYKETTNDEGGKSVTFILDIDSLKQTFVVKTGWSKNASVVYETILECPPQSEMKYKETICYGTYNSTYSLNLYLPYPTNSNSPEEYISGLYIEGDETKKTITIHIIPCREEELRKKALEYLNSTPIKLDEYKLEYDVNGTDADC